MPDPDRRFASIILSVPTLLPILLTGCGAAEHGETLAMRSMAAQHAAGLALPVSAEVVFAHQMHGMDDAAQIIAVMSIADWRSLEPRIEATVPVRRHRRAMSKPISVPITASGSPASNAASPPVRCLGEVSWRR